MLTTHYPSRFDQPPSETMDDLICKPEVRGELYTVLRENIINCVATSTRREFGVVILVEVNQGTYIPTPFKERSCFRTVVVGLAASITFKGSCQMNILAVLSCRTIYVSMRGRWDSFYNEDRQGLIHPGAFKNCKHN